MNPAAMRHLLICSGLTLLAAAACDSAPEEIKDPPVLRVTSPSRSTLQNRAGLVQVTGTVAPNEISGERVEKVLVNGVQATVNADGTFIAVVDVRPGATLIHTVARDAAGQEASDTRAVQAGQLRPGGGTVDDAITAPISKQAFAKLSAAAGPMIENMDMAALLAPMQPMVRAGDENGEDCLFGRVYVDDVNMANAEISIIPTNAGLSFRAQIDGLDVPGRARYAVACVDGSNTVRVRAERVVVSGTLVVTPSGNQGFKTTLANETVKITGLDIDASGIPGNAIDMLSLDSLAGFVISKAAPLAMEPMMNKALGGLAGPQQIDVMGKTLTVEVDPTAIDITSAGAMVTLSTKTLISGAEKSPGYVFTDNGLPAMDTSAGFQVGLADDMANELLAEVKEIGLLNLSMPAHGGTFDNTAIQMTLPPMISADPADGKMKVVLGDMIATLTDHGTPVAKTAVNVTIELKVVPASNGYGVALELGKPEAHVDVLEDIENRTRMTHADLAKAMDVCLEAQVTAISKLLTNIPLPAVAGLQMRNMSVAADDGYVMLKGDID